MTPAEEDDMIRWWVLLHPLCVRPDRVLCVGLENSQRRKEGRVSLGSEVGGGHDMRSTH